jgi:hypothetical protein
MMGSPTKKAAFEKWKMGASLRDIQIYINLLHRTTSRTTVKKWVRFWDRKRKKHSGGTADTIHTLPSL